MKIDRLIGILSILLQKETVTAPYLAEKFEVSRRTISRDIDTLCKAGIPLVTSQGRGGGISIMDGYRIDRTLLTASDMRAILAGLKSLDSVSQTNRYKALMDKLHLENPDILGSNSHIVINLGSWYRDSLAPKIEFLQNAIANHSYIRFHYCAPAGESVRTIEPYLLIFQWSSWYIWGYCLTRNDFRLFKLNRMQELALTGGSFPPRETPGFRMDPAGLYAPTFSITVRFQPKVKWRLLDEYGPDSFQTEPDGTLLFTYGFFDKESAFSWLLSFGDQARLLSPAPLAEEFSRLAKSISELYSSARISSAIASYSSSVK